MENRTVKYIFKFDDDTQEVFNVDLGDNNSKLVSEIMTDPPQWINLDFHQCPNCTFDIKTHAQCPLAASLVNIVKSFEKIISYDEVDVTVVTEERSILKHTSAQQAISSLMGLVIANSGCPFTDFFKPMAYFHLPFASEEETICRATSMYLLSQFFVEQKNGKGDFKLDGLKQIYNNMQTVNMAITERLRFASKTDSSVNAIIILGLFAKGIPYVIEDSLEEIQDLFTASLTKFCDNSLNDRMKEK